MNFSGDHNLGLYVKTSDKFSLVGNFVSENDLLKIKDFLKVEVIRTTISNTDLIGMFVCLNSNGVLLPKIISNRETERLNALKNEFDMNIGILKSKFTAIGNLILANDKGAIVSKVFKRTEKKIIEDCLSVEVGYSSISNMEIVGSTGVATNKGCLLHRDATEEEIKKIEEILKVKCDIGTANFGSPFVGSCIFANSNGALVGESTTGPEIVRITEALDLI